MLVFLKSPLWIGFNVGGLEICRLKVEEILSFEQSLSLEIQLNNKKMILKGEISWVTSSHSGNWHTLQ